MPIDRRARNPTRLGRVRFDYTGIDRETFARDEPLVHAPLHDTLEDVPEGIALAKATVPVLGEVE